MTNSIHKYFIIHGFRVIVYHVIYECIMYQTQVKGNGWSHDLWGGTTAGNKRDARRRWGLQISSSCRQWWNNYRAVNYHLVLKSVIKLSKKIKCVWFGSIWTRNLTLSLKLKAWNLSFNELWVEVVSLELDKMSCSIVRLVRLCIDNFCIVLYYLFFSYR